MWQEEKWLYSSKRRRREVWLREVVDVYFFFGKVLVEELRMVSFGMWLDVYFKFVVGHQLMCSFQVVICFIEAIQRQFYVS